MLNYCVYGDITHPTLIFLHGFLGMKEDWIPLMKQLKDSFFCAFDLDPQFELMDTVQAMLEHFPLNNPTLIGYSMGGRVGSPAADAGL